MAKPRLTLVRMNKPAGVCKFAHCDHPIRHQELEICYRCYSYLRIWRDRHPQAKRDRMTQIKSLEERMEYMMLATGPMPKKVKPKKGAKK